MSTIRNPVGPQPTNVYWRRRLIVLGGLLVVVIIILLIVFSPKGDSTPTADPKSSSTSTAPADDAAAGGDPVACNPDAISVTAVTDALSYPEGQNPLISMTISNNGAVACTINAGTDVQLYSITSGSDPIWNSKDCQVESTPSEVTLEPGDVSTTPITWDRTRSSTTTCESQRPPVIAGGASYRLSVSLGDIESAEPVQFVLN